MGISSASLYPQYPTEVALLNIAALGCRAVEVYLQTRREYTRAYARCLKRLCISLGINVLSLHAASSQFEPMLFYRYLRQNLDGWDTLNQVLETACILGSGCYVFHGPLRVDNHDLPSLLEGLHQAADTAAAWGMKLAFENVSWGAGWTPDVFRWLREKNVPNLYFTLDTKQAWRSGSSPGIFIDAMDDRLANVHISDGMGGLPIKQAEYFQIAQKLHEIGYKGPIILEVYGNRVASTSQLAKSWHGLKRVYNK